MLKIFIDRLSDVRYTDVVIERDEAHPTERRVEEDENMKVTGYIYNVESKEVVVEVIGEQRSVEAYADESYADEAYGLTYSPAFGAVDGLIETTETKEIEL